MSSHLHAHSFHIWFRGVSHPYLPHQRLIVDSEPHIIWIDNFSKLYLARMIDMEKHHLQKLLWSGIAVKRFVFPDEVSDAVMRDDAGFVIPAVAADPSSTSYDCPSC